MRKFLIIYIIFLFTINIQAEEPRFRMEDRVFEMGIANVDLGYANNLLNAGEIFQEKLILDFTKLDGDFNLAFNLNVRPLYFNVKIQERWGIGLDIANVSVYGNANISGNLLNLYKSSGDTFGAGAAAFIDVGIPVFFTIDNVWDRKLKINIRPAGFVTAAYSSPSMRYTFIDFTEDEIRGSQIEIDFGIKAFTPFSLDPELDAMSTLDVGSALGFDFSVGAEYPLYKWLDIGVQFTNIPLCPSRLKNYIELKGKVVLDSTNIVISDLIDGGALPEGTYITPDDFEPYYKTVSDDDKLYFFRPFKMVFNAKYRPFETTILTIAPLLGFSINPLYVQAASIEAGVKVSCDLSNIFIPTLGISYEDRMWQNSIGFSLNLRAFQLDFGIGMQSQNFVKSWTAGGLRANVGLIFGW